MEGRNRDSGRVRSRLAAIVGSAVFFAVAPVGVAGLIPWWLTGWQIDAPLPFWGPLRILGAALTAAGGLVVLSAFARFALEGIGTPAPVAPPRQLVVGGPYRFVRNPIYLAVVTVILGEALLLGQLGLLAYAGVVGLVMAAFARWVEEPELLERFGAEYDQYRRKVPGWWPRLRPWNGS